MPEFCKYLTYYDVVPHDNITPRELLNIAIDNAGDLAALPNGLTMGQYDSECQWIEAKRPYYNVYLPMADALSRVKLDIDCQHLELPLKQFAIRFPEPGWQGVRSMLVGYVNLIESKDKGLGVWADFGERYQGCMPITTYSTFGITPGMTIEESLDSVPASPSFTDEDRRRMRQCISIALAVCLLDKDSPLVSADVLTQDRVKLRQNPANVTALQEKAKKRGKFGWTIGSSEVSPHFRRPHLAKRHVGPGRKQLRIVSIDATMVHRRKITAVPTDYEE